MTRAKIMWVMFGVALASGGAATIITFRGYAPSHSLLLARLVPEAPPAPIRDRPNFGGGYKGVRWGTSLERVKAFVGTTPTREYNDSVAFEDAQPSGDSGRSQVEYEFFEGELYRVTYTPPTRQSILSAYDWKDREAAMGLLISKYGQPSKTTSTTEEFYTLDGFADLPTTNHKWSDGETGITFAVTTYQDGSCCRHLAVVFESVALRKREKALHTQQAVQDTQARAQGMRDDL